MAFEIVATGSYVPRSIMTNFDLEKYCDTNDEWIFSRTGIKSRHYAEEETTEDLGVYAGKQALERAGVCREDIDAVIVATFTPEYLTPSIACMIQSRLNLRQDILAFDMNAACSGFLYGLKVADSLFSSMREGSHILLVGAEIISRVLDLSDRGTGILFGDGAGAVVLRKRNERPTFFLTGSRGTKEELGCPGINSEGLNSKVYMNGKEVFRFATSTVSQCVQVVMEEEDLSKDEIDYVVCHQANQRIISYVQKKLDFPEEKFYSNIEHYGNTSSASIPLVLDEMMNKGLLKRGMKIILVGFGAGLTWGAALIEW